MDPHTYHPDDSIKVPSRQTGYPEGIPSVLYSNVV